MMPFLSMGVGRSLSFLLISALVFLSISDAAPIPIQQRSLIQKRTPPSYQQTEFRNAVLSTVNALRKKHGASDLKWDDTLAQYAQKQSNKCDFPLKHSGGPYGENIGAYMGSSGEPNWIDQTKSQISQGWYGEVKAYDYKNADPTPSNCVSGDPVVCHFTQVVWKGTTKIGCSWNSKACPAVTTTDSSGKKTSWPEYGLLFCEFSPRGNVADNFGANVGIAQ